MFSKVFIQCDTSTTNVGEFECSVSLLTFNVVSLFDFSQASEHEVGFLLWFQSVFPS